MGVNVAVTGLHAADNPAPGVGVIRCLRYPDGWDGQIIGLGYNVYDTGIYDEALLDSAYLIPYPNQGPERVFERLMYIHDRERIDVLIPTLDSELALFQKLQPRLEEAGIRLFLPDEKSVSLSTKAELPEFCEQHQIPTPKTIVLRDPARLEEAVEEVGLPLMVKGVFYEAYKCHSLAEARFHFLQLQAKWGLPVIVQAMLTGDEYDVCAVTDGAGQLVGAVPIRKTALTDKGKAWSAVTLYNEDLLDFARKVLRDLKWSGPCELEIIREERTGAWQLMEINPRFPAWIFLSAGAKQNLPRLVVELALGHKVEPLPPAESGVTFVRHAVDLVCPLEYVESLTVLGELHYKQTPTGPQNGPDKITG